MHIGDKYPNFKYQISDQEPSNVKQEKDLEVITSSNLKMSDKCTKTTIKEITKILGFISIYIFFS